MKKPFYLLLAMLACLPTLLGAQAGGSVRFAIGDWAPYTSSNDPRCQFTETIVTEAFRLQGMEVSFEYFPWKRSYDFTRAGKVDGTFPWTITPERRVDFLIPAMPLFRDEGVYFHLKTTKFDWNTLDDLKKYKVGVTIGYKDETRYREGGIKADPVPQEDLNFKKMLVGRIDIYQASKIVGYRMIKSLFSPEDAARFTNHAKPAEISDYFILFSRKTSHGQAIADAFDAGFAKLKDSGRYDIIVKNFMNDQ
jgi:polar amino acid transport system substrate-binding protein